MNRWLALLPLVALVALAALFVGWSLNRDPQVKPDAMVGKPVPVTVLPLLNGPGKLDLKTAGVGKPMIVNVFASSSYSFATSKARSSSRPLRAMRSRAQTDSEIESRRSVQPAPPCASR